MLFYVSYFRLVQLPYAALFSVEGFYGHTFLYGVAHACYVWLDGSLYGK